MLATTVLMLALTATGFAQAPAGYRTVYLTSMVDKKFAIAPKTPVKSGTTIVVYVYLLNSRFYHLKPDFFLAKRLIINQISNGISRTEIPRFSWQLPLSAWMRVPRVSVFTDISLGDM